MDIIKRIGVYIKKATYINRDDERLFIYRDEKYKWFGLSINFGHPKAKRCLLSVLGLVILYILLSAICCWYGDRFRSLVIETIFVVVISWQIRRAYDIAEYGGAQNRGVHGDVLSRDVQEPWHRKINSFFIIKLVLFMLPMFYAINVRLHDQRYCIFLCVLCMVTLFQMVMFAYNFFIKKRKKTTK